MALVDLVNDLVTASGPTHLDNCELRITAHRNVVFKIKMQLIWLSITADLRPLATGSAFIGGPVTSPVRLSA